MLPISTVTRFSQAAGASKAAWGKDGDFCFRAKPLAGSPVPEAAHRNIHRLASPCREEVTAQAPSGWQTDPHLPVHSSPQKSVLHSSKVTHLVSLAQSGWATGRAEVSPKRLQKCTRGMCTKPESPDGIGRAGPYFRGLLKSAGFEITSGGLDLKHPETGGQFSGLLHKQPCSHL